MTSALRELQMDAAYVYLRFQFAVLYVGGVLEETCSIEWSRACWIPTAGQADGSNGGQL